MLYPDTPILNPSHTPTRESPHWIRCVDIGVFRSDLHDVLSKWCQVPQATKPYFHLQINRLDRQVQDEEEEEEEEDEKYEGWLRYVELGSAKKFLQVFIHLSNCLA